MTSRDDAWQRMLLAARTRALHRLIKERDHLATVHPRIAQYARVGRTLYKLAATGDLPVKPSDIIRNAEDPRPCKGNANICVAEGCFGRACEKETK